MEKKRKNEQGKGRDERDEEMRLWNEGTLLDNFVENYCSSTMVYGITGIIPPVLL